MDRRREDRRSVGISLSSSLLGFTTFLIGEYWTCASSLRLVSLPSEVEGRCGVGMSRSFDLLGFTTFLTRDR